MTSSASKKRRRRREREKRTQDLLQRARAISLVDVASPPPAKRSMEDTQQDVPELASKGRSQTATTNGSHAPAFSSTNLPQQEPSWKRVEFVLPRADGKKPFVFDRQKTPEISNKPSLLPNVDEADEKLKEYRKFETIEDILFAGKRKKESPNKHDASPDQDESSRKKTKQHDKNQTIISESQCKTLEDAFESVQKPENGMAIGNFINMPEQNGGQTTSSPDEKPKPALKTENPESHQQRKRSSSVTIAPSSPGQISGRTVKEAVRDKRGLRPRANSTDGELNLPRGGLCDERMILEAHKWLGGKKFMNQAPPRGLHNLGNTCFLNATLQCLAYLPPLCQALITLSNSKIGHDQNGGKRKIPQGQKITNSLCHVFQQAHYLTNGSSKAGGPFAPKKVVGHLQNIGSCGSRNGYKFRLGRQEDAHEFLVHLLDAINDGELRAAGINQNVSGWRDRLPVPRLDETTFVHRIFGGYFRSQIRCRRCNYKSNTYDPFLDLSLEVSKKSSTSVLRALSEFTRKETLDAANQWKCSGCKKYVCATKQLTVFRPPLTLCIQLKRFAFDNFGFGQKFSKYHHGGYGGGGGSKITKPIEFPGSLNLPLSDNRNCQYTLTGVVIHVGGSASSGHYTAYVKKPGKNGTNQWYHMDDDYVGPVSEKTVLRQKDAYLLFYCRTEVKLEFPDPPSKSMSASEATEFGRTRALARAKSLPSESMKKELIEQGVGENAINGILNMNISAPKQEITASSSKKDKKETLERVKTTIHPLADTHTSPRTIVAAKPEESEDSDASSTSSPPSSSNILIESGKAKDTAESDSSDDPSYNQNSADSDSSSDSESSSEIDAPLESPKERPVAQKTEDESSSESEMESQAEKKKSTRNKDESDDSSSQSSESEEKTDIVGEDSPVDKKKIKGLAKKYMGAPTESSKQSKDSAESDIDGSDSESSSDEEKKSENSDKKPAAAVAAKRPQVVQNNTDSRGKVKVVLGSRKRKAWESLTSTLPSKGSNFHLLGNRKVSQWDDDDEENDDSDNNKNGAEIRKREKIVDSIEKHNRKKKRKMHLDRWDSHLDQGRMKKIKSKANDNPHETSSKAPKKNIFQKIQSSVQKMSRGKPKGGFRNKFKKRKGGF